MRYRQATRNTDIETDMFLELYKRLGITTGIMWSYGKIASSVVCLSSDYMQHGVKTTKINIWSNLPLTAGT